MKIEEIVFNNANDFKDQVLSRQVQRRQQLFLTLTDFQTEGQFQQVERIIREFDAKLVPTSSQSISLALDFAAWQTFAQRMTDSFSDENLAAGIQAISSRYEVHWQAGRFNFNVTTQPIIYGIMNITPDSFYDGGRFQDPVAVEHQIEKMVAAGANVIEVGGQTTRPGFVEISATEELQRISNAVDLIKTKHPQIAVAVDTYKLPVMREMVALGVDIINDVNAFTDDARKLSLLAPLTTGLLTMHSSRQTEYDNLTAEMRRFFEQNIQEITAAGVDRQRIALDQGIGYSKVADGYQDYAMMRNIDQFNYLGRPLMVAISRKGFGAKLFGLPKDERLSVTLIAEAYMYLHGGRILRVHDVAETVQLTKMLDTISAGYWHRD